MDTSIHCERVDADLRYIGVVLEKIKHARHQIQDESVTEIAETYEQLNRRMDEAAEKLDSLRHAGPGVAEDLARALDELVVELKAGADCLLTQVGPAAART